MQARRTKSHRPCIAILAHRSRTRSAPQPVPPNSHLLAARRYPRHECAIHHRASRYLHHQTTIMQLDPVRQWCCAGDRRKEATSVELAGRFCAPAHTPARTAHRKRKLNEPATLRPGICFSTKFNRFTAAPPPSRGFAQSKKQRLRWYLDRRSQAQVRSRTSTTLQRCAVPTLAEPTQSLRSGYRLPFRRPHSATCRSTAAWSAMRIQCQSCSADG